MANLTNGEKILATLRKAGMTDAMIQASGMTEGIAALKAERAAIRAASAPAVALLNEQAGATLDALRFALGFDIKLQSELVGLTIAELRTSAPDVATMVDLLGTHSPANARKGDTATRKTARSKSKWSLFAGLDRKWIAVAGYGAHKALRQSGAVYTIEPPAIETDSGIITWWTPKLGIQTVDDNPSLAASQRGAIRPTEAFMGAIAALYGRFDEYAESLYKPITDDAGEVTATPTEQLVEVMTEAKMKFIELPDLGSPSADWDTDTLAKAYKDSPLTDEYLTV